MFQAYISAHNILERVQQLEAEFEMRTGDLTPLIHKYESLDSSIMEAMLAAEKACCKSKHGYAWSLKLVQAGKQVQYWKTCKSSLNKKLSLIICFIWQSIQKSQMIQV
eukprot:6891107-Ditylum_brightwellii.AAC.1